MAALVRRARQAGATGRRAFADWLIFDVEWFGPCTGLDTPTYLRRRRRAEAMYDGRRDAFVARGQVSPTPRPRLHDAQATAAVRTLMIFVGVMLMVALASVGTAITGGPPGMGHPADGSSNQEPGVPAPRACTSVPGQPCIVAPSSTMDNP